MSRESFDIYFSGKLLPDHSRGEVRESMRRLFRASGPQLDRLFNGSRVCVKRDVDAATAIRYRTQLRSVGALIEIQPRTSPADVDPERFRRIFDGSGDLMLLLRPDDGQIIDCNPRTEAVLGFDRPALLAMRVTDLSDDDQQAFHEFAEQVLASGTGHSAEFEYLTRTGERVPMEVSASAIDVEAERALLFIARDVTARKLADSRMQHLAYHDTLTDLPNRSLLRDRVQSALARARRSGDLGALLFLDLDNFKRINDTLGHAVGDRLLQELAGRLTGALRAEDTVARLGGDEFVVLVERLGSEPLAARPRIDDIVAKIRSAMSRAYRLDGHELYVTASIGIVTFPTNGHEVDELLRFADVAMYRAKESGRNAARIFSSDMTHGAMERLELESELRHALHRGGLLLHFQPVMTLREGQMVGAEALLRWRHPDNMLITPSEFMPQIEDDDLMLQLSDWVVEEACRTLAELQSTDAFAWPSYIAVNLSPQQFRQPDFVDRVSQVLQATGADPHLLQFEITEAALEKDALLARQHLLALRQLGIRFAIDDFGTGSSSLANLKALPLDSLKIDREFVSHLMTDPNDTAIVEAILSLARHFDLTAIAEGVENREQLLFLRKHGCHYYQGILGRPPLSRAELGEEIEQRAALLA